MAFDYKKEYKEFYMPKNKPSIVEIPKMNYIAVRGTGDPNEENGDYQKLLGMMFDYRVISGIAEKETDSLYVNPISIYNNLQNPISSRDMVANNYEQNELHKKLKSGDAPNIFMEIKRGQYVPSQPRFEKHQQTSNEDIAQVAAAAFLVEPFKAKDKKKTLFNKDAGSEEYIVNEYYDEIFKGKNVEVCDIGTGSGAISIALSKEEPKMNVTATDISKEALEIAKLNAKNNLASIKFLEGDLLEPLITNNLKFDILVSNPPYIALGDEVDPLVVKNEPHLALFAENNGMECYERILKDASKVLNKTNIILFEHGYKQKDLMLKLIDKYYPNSECEIIKDLSGNDRCVRAVFAG